MIYLLFGTDTEKSRVKLNGLVGSLIAKKPDASRGRFTADTFKPALLDELSGGQGLFSNKLIVEFDRLFENLEYKEFILDNLDRLAESKNIFVIREGPLLVKELKLFEKHAEKVQEFVLAERALAREASPFAMADALGRRDKKTLWTLYTLAKRKGAVDEEIHGMLFWQVKSILLAASAQSPVESGLKPFVFSKAKSFSNNFSSAELQNLSSRLVSIYHDAHRGVDSLGGLLEELILGL